MIKRKLLLNEYDTATHFWTLSFCFITKAIQIQNIVEVAGRYAPLDLSTVLTDGQPFYGNATLDAVLETSEGTKSERQNRIDEFVNYIDGHVVKIVHPDHPGRYMIGRTQVQLQYNDFSHAAVQLSAVCEPWFYNEDETVVTLEATETEQTAQLINAGRLAVVPAIIVSGDVVISVGASSYGLSTGSYFLPELQLMPGVGLDRAGIREISYKGFGSITIKYREAVLAA